MEQISPSNHSQRDKRFCLERDLRIIIYLYRSEALLRELFLSALFLQILLVFSLAYGTSAPSIENQLTQGIQKMYLIFFVLCIHIHLKFIINVDITNNAVNVVIIKL